VRLASAHHEGAHATIAEVCGLPVVVAEVGTDGDFSGRVQFDIFWRPGERRAEEPIDAENTLAESLGVIRGCGRLIYATLPTDTLKRLLVALAAGRCASWKFMSEARARAGAALDLEIEGVLLSVLAERGTIVSEGEAAALVEANWMAIEDLGLDLLRRGRLAACEIREILHEHGVRTTDDLVRTA